MFYFIVELITQCLPQEQTPVLLRLDNKRPERRQKPNYRWALLAALIPGVLLVLWLKSVF
jgi:hypothetical protein